MTAAAAVLFIGIGYTNTFGVFSNHYQRQLLVDVAPEKIILIGSVASSLYFILGAFTGRFADLVGYRVSLILGAGLMVAALFAASVSTKFWQLFLSQGLTFGLGLAFVYMPTTTISRQYFGARMHGLANGIIISGGALGGCVLPFCVEVMMAKYGLAKTFRILGYIAIGVLVPSVFFLKPRMIQLPRTARGPLLDVELLQNERFLWLLAACTVAMIGFLPRYFLIPSSAEAKGIGSTYASWLLGLMNGLSIIGRVGIGYLSDRLGKLTALTVSFLLCGIGHIIFWLPAVSLQNENTETATALFTLFVIFVGVLGSGQSITAHAALLLMQTGFISLFPVVVADMFGSENLASKTGLLNTAVGFGTLAGPSAVYAIIGSGMQRKWTAGVLTAGLLMLVGGILLSVLSAPWNKIRRRGVEAELDDE